MTRKILKKLDWIWDFYFSYLLYNSSKLTIYHNYMVNKWGDKYKNRLI